MNIDARLPWNEAAKTYWYHLAAAPFFAPFASYTVNHPHGHIWGIAIIFCRG
jgi:hypothetical protein